MKKILFNILSFLLLLNVTAQTQSVAFWELNEKTFDWINSNPQYNGVIRTIKHSTKDYPRPLKINAVRLELAKVSPILGKKDKKWGQPMPDYPQHSIRTKRQTTRDFVKNLQLQYKRQKQPLEIIFACNTAPWRPWTKPYNHKYADYRGFIVSDSEVISTGFENEKDLFPILYWDKQNKIGIKVPSINEDLTQYNNAVFAFAILLKDGQSFADLPTQKGFTNHKDFEKLYPTINKILFPSIAIGFDKDKKYLYIVSVDGRQPKVSEGVYAKEMAKIIKYFGAYNAVLMDGGGSTTMLVVDEKTKKINRLNTHPKPNKERKVGISIAFKLNN